jgi:type IV pilus assembly protein PilQ
MKNNNSKRLALIGALLAPVLARGQEVAVTETASPAAVVETQPVPAPITAETPVAASVAPAEQAPAVATEGVPSVAVPAEPAAVQLTEIAPTPAGPTEVPATAATAGIAAPKLIDTLSVDFPDEDVRSILRNVADLFELNIVVPDTLQGRTSIKLRDVTWRQIFSVVLTPVNYTFLEEGNIIKVVTVDSLALEPLTTEVFILNYARADEVLSSILPLVDSAAGGRVLVDKRINALIISERASKIVKINPVLKSLDKVTEQVMIETKFISVDTDTADNFGIQWETAQGTLFDNNNTSTYAGSGRDLKTYSDSLNYTTSVLSNLQLKATLNILQKSGSGKVVSNPTVVTLNNTESFINVGEEYPIPSYTYNSERGSFEVSGFEYKPIGIILKVTPQINNDNFIKLLVEPEVSERKGDVNFSGASIPIIGTSRTKTQVSLKDGHTLAIGGLIKDTLTKSKQKVPVLGSIPGVGRLFRSDQDSSSRQNLMIFITAKIVSADSAKPQDIFDPRQIRDAEVKRSDIGGYRDSSNPFLPEVPAQPAPKK